MITNPLAADQAEALTRLAALANKQGIHPDKFRTDQLREFLEVFSKLIDDLSLISPARGAAFAAAAKDLLPELHALYNYLVHLKDHPLDWPAKQ